MGYLKAPFKCEVTQLDETNWSLRLEDTRTRKAYTVVSTAFPSDDLADRLPENLGLTHNAFQVAKGTVLKALEAAREKSDDK